MAELLQKEIYCDPCKEDGNLVSAEGFCGDCLNYLCGQCYNNHRSFENHLSYMCDKDTMPDPAQVNLGAPDVCVEKCSNHPNKMVEFFCGTCYVLGCNACITANHNQCEKVVHVHDISEEFTEFDEQLSTIDKELVEHKERIASNTEMNIQMKKLAKEELTKQRNKMNTFFDDLEKEMDLEIENIQQDNSIALKAASDTLESVEKEFKDMKTSIDSKRNGQNCELFIAMKKNRQKIETFKEQFNKLSDDRRIQKYTLRPSEQIEDMMRTTTEICRLTTARFQAKIDIRTSQNKFSPLIWGLTVVHGHYCVVTDDMNKSVKVVDTRSKCVTSEIGIDAGYVCALATVNNDCVAVSVILRDFQGFRFQIQFFSVSSSGVITSTAKLFDVESHCRALEYWNDKLFLHQSKQILICNIEGQELKTIKNDSAGVAIFEGVTGISLSPDGQTIYVTDAIKNSVTSMTLEGNVTVVYTDKDLKRPNCITVDRDGYVYVHSADTGSIHQLTADLSNGQIIIDDVHGQAITYSRAENKLYLSEGKCISVYEVMTR